MNTARLLAAAAGMVAASAGAQAQETITFNVEFAKAVLQPGEVQGISVWAELAPGPGATAIYNLTGAVGTVHAFGAAIFDLTNVSNGETGVFSNLKVNSKCFLAPTHGYPDGNGNVIAIGVGQGGFLGQMCQDNPILLWTALWTPDTYDEREVAFKASPTSGPKALLELDGLPVAIGDPWTALTPTSSFQVVPAPGAAVVLGVGAMCLARRRRAPG